MAVREQTVRELSDVVAERWRNKQSYDKTTFRTMVARAIRGRGITDQQDAGELLKRIAEECAKRSASHRKSRAALRKIAS
jgi:hypothetical protein